VTRTVEEIEIIVDYLRSFLLPSGVSSDFAFRATELLVLLTFFGIGLLTIALVWHNGQRSMDAWSRVSTGFGKIFSGAQILMAASLRLLRVNWGMIVLIFSLVGVFLMYLYVDPAGRYDLTRVQPELAVELHAADNTILDHVYTDQMRIWVPLSEIDRKLVSLVMFLEDDRFFQHFGLDITEIYQSVATNLKTKRFARGGSTITQQLVKNLYLTRDKNLRRKMLEVPIAMRLERRHTKEEILHTYMNIIEWGPGIYGAEAAARYYFDKSARDLSLAECYFLALIVPNPRLFSPYHEEIGMLRVRKKLKGILRRLYLEGIVSKQERWAHGRLEFSLSNMRQARKYPVYDALQGADRPQWLQLFGEVVQKNPGWRREGDGSYVVKSTVYRPLQKLLDQFETSHLGRLTRRLAATRLGDRRQIVAFSNRAGDVIGVSVLPDLDGYSKLIDFLKAKVKRMPDHKAFSISDFNWAQLVDQKPSFRTPASGPSKTMPRRSKAAK
jgi:hypothetical protein